MTSKDMKKIKEAKELELHHLRKALFFIDMKDRWDINDGIHYQEVSTRINQLENEIAHLK